MKPILFNTDMVKAILDGQKTVTRRIMKNPPLDIETVKFRELRNGNAVFEWDCSTNLCERKALYCPGDILYVRETFFTFKEQYYYKADEKHISNDSQRYTSGKTRRASVSMC